MVDTADAPPSMENADNDMPDFLSLFEPTEENICEFGDIVLVADDGFHPALKIRVSSCILAMASKPFKALFSRRFAEGKGAQGRNSSNPHEITVKDSPRSLSHLCRILHHQSPVEGDKVPTQRELLQLAVIADKYDCIEALRLPADALLQRFVNTSPFCNFAYDLDLLATAAYLLDQPRHFRHFTKGLVLVICKIQQVDLDAQCLERLPSNLVPFLSAQQNTILQQLTFQITTIIDDFERACTQSVSYSKMQELFSELRRLKLWPLRDDSINLGELLRLFERVQLPALIKRNRPGRVTGSTPPPIWPFDTAWEPAARTTFMDDDSIPAADIHLTPGEHSSNDDDLEVIEFPSHISVANAIDRIKELCVGVCLDCLRGRECFWPDLCCPENTTRSGSASHSGDWDRKRSFTDASW